MRESLVLDGVGKCYRRGQQSFRVLEDVALRVRPREIVAIVGSRDDGKTTLLKVAAGIEPADVGSVVLDGVDMTRLSQTRRERLLGSRIAWTHREKPALDWRVVDFVGLPLTMGRKRGLRRTRRAAMAALERVGAAHCASQRWSELSNWERMLVALARALVGGPSLLVIDDLLDGFGTLRAKEAGDLLRGLVDEVGCGVLMTSTSFDVAVFADRVYSLAHGRLKLMSDQSPRNAEVIELRRGAGPGAVARRLG